MRGEYAINIVRSFQPIKSSPLARGIHLPLAALEVRSRIIPACAGNTKSDKYCQNLYWDHPRLCGEYAEGMALKDCLIGSSPLVRGIQAKEKNNVIFRGIIPACAGNTSIGLSKMSTCKDHPRLCGEYDAIHLISPLFIGSSPLVRGIHSKKLDFP